MNLPHCRPWFVAVDDSIAVDVYERTAAGAAISAAVQIIPRAERRGWPDTSQHHVAYVAVGDGTVIEIAVWFEPDGHPRTFTPGEAP